MSVRYLQQRGDGIVTCILCRTRLGLLVSVSIVLQSSKALKVEERCGIASICQYTIHNLRSTIIWSVASSFSTDDPAAAAAAWCRCVVL